MPLSEHWVTNVLATTLAEIVAGYVKIMVAEAGKSRSDTSVKVAEPMVCTNCESGAIDKELRVPVLAVY